MKIYGLVLAASGLVLGACGGGDKGADTAAAKTDTTAAMNPPAAAPGAATTGAAAAGAPAAVTGKVTEVKMMGDAQGYREDPMNITIKVGDGVKWTNVSGGPHNVSFWADSLPAGVQAQLQANMANTTSPLVGPLLINPNDSYSVSFAGVKPGKYPYYCTPHLALGMRGTITVQ